MNQYSKKNYYYGRPFNKAEENKFIYHVLFLTTSFFYCHCENPKSEWQSLYSVWDCFARFHRFSI